MFKAVWLDGGGDLSLPRSIREEVFCREQGYPLDDEFDDADARAIHLLITENGEAVATGRLFEEGGLYKLGRICARKPFRGQGFGDMVVRLMLDKALSLGAVNLYISSQDYIRDMYTKFGFTQRGESYRLPGDTRDHVDLYATAEDIVFPSECKGGVSKT